MRKTNVNWFLAGLTFLAFQVIPLISPALYSQEVITKWTFDNTTEPAQGDGTASLIGGVTQHSATSTNGWRFTDFPDQYEGSGDAGAQFMVSTEGFENIVLDFQHRSSGTMSRWAGIQYTTNGGNTWLVLDNNGGNLSPHDIFYPFSFDFSALDEANNNPLFGVRIVSIFSPVAFNPEVPDSTFDANTAYHRARTLGTGGNAYTGGGNWRLLEVTFSGDEILGALPEKLVISEVNGGDPPFANIPFDVVVQALDADNFPSNVTTETQVTLSKETGSGILGGTLSGSIAAGSNTLVFSNVLYDTPEAGVSISASAASGMELAPGISDPFEVLGLNPAITLISPNGGEIWEQGSTQTIQWTSEDFTGNVKITLLRSPFFSLVLADSIPDTGSWEWEISPTQAIASNYKIRVQDAANSSILDESDDVFSITEATIPKDIITQWTFDGTTDPSIGAGAAGLIGGATQHSATIENGWRITDFPDQFEASGTAGAQFMLSTLGYEEITLSFGHRASGTMSRWGEIQYTVDGGDTWLTLDNNEGNLTPHDVVYPFSFDYSAINEVNDNPQFGFRIVSIFSPEAFNPEVPDTTYDANTAYHRARTPGTGGGAYSGSGNWRLLEVTVSGYPKSPPAVFYSKPIGALNQLSTWGSQPDGGGIAPTSFNIDFATFFVHNRPEVALQEDWSVGGSGSKVILGDGENPVHLTLNAWLDAVVDISEMATLTLAVGNYPVFGDIESGSKVIFTGNALQIPYATYHHLQLDDIVPEFNGNGTVSVRGDLTLSGAVNMPDARGGSEYSILFSGPYHQIINTNGNVLRSFNMNFVKAEGAVNFAEGSIISTDNQLTLNIGADAAFHDNGIAIYAGNSVNIAGDGGAYNFTGTLILAGTEDGIVKGVGAGNNFNIRESGNTNIVAELNNLVISVENTDGEFRFRDGSSNVFTINGDFIVQSEAAGRIRFYENELFVSGNFIIEEGFAGSIDALKAVTFAGSGDMQEIIVPAGLSTQELIVDNIAGIMIDGIVEVSALLTFINGLITVEDDGVLILGLDASVEGFGEANYVEGKLGIRAGNTDTDLLLFTIGIAGEYLPLSFVVAHLDSDEALYITNVKAYEPLAGSLPASLDYIDESFMYVMESQGDAMISGASVTLLFDEANLGFDSELLRVAKFIDGEWFDLGGTIDNGMITSTVNFTQTGIFALAKAAEEITETELIYFWVFDNNLPNNTPIETINATFGLTGGGLLSYHSALAGYPFDPTHPNWRKASLERRNAPTPINYRPEGNNNVPYAGANVLAVQVKQPFTGDGGENTLIFHMPTTGFKDVVFSFAAKDEGAADMLIIDYSVVPGEPVWTTDGLAATEFPLSPDYLLYSIDYSNGPGDVNGNPFFKIRIRFDGDDMTVDAGNRVTFNNVSLDGVLDVDAYQILTIPAGWSGISSFIVPAAPALEDIFEPAASSLIILQNFDGFYWPADGSNTLGSWSDKAGYAIKTNAGAQVIIAGTMQPDMNLTLNEGWNFLPVLGNCTYQVADLFDQISGKVVIVKEIAGYLLFWPENEINTLGTLEPGKAYYIKLSEDAMITFPDCVE